jgi:hypothetical protein
MHKFLLLFVVSSLVFAHTPDCDFSMLKRLAGENPTKGVELAIEYLQRTKPGEEIPEPGALRYIGENGTLADAGILQGMTTRYGKGTDHLIRRAIDQIRILNGHEPIYFKTNTAESPFLKTFGLDGYTTLTPAVFAEKFKENEKYLTPEDLAYFAERLSNRAYVSAMIKETKMPFVLPVQQKDFFINTLRAKLLMKEGLAKLEGIKDTKLLSNLLYDLVRSDDIVFLTKFGQPQDIPTLQRLKYLYDLCAHEKNIGDKANDVSRAIEGIQDRYFFKEMPRLVEEGRRSILTQISHGKRTAQTEFSDLTPLYYIDRFGGPKEIPLLNKIIQTYPFSSETVKMAKKVLANLKKEKYSDPKNIEALTSTTLIEPAAFNRKLNEIEPYLTQNEVEILAEKLPWHNRLMFENLTLKAVPKLTQPQTAEILRNLRRYFEPDYSNNLPDLVNLPVYIKFLSEHGAKQDLDNLKNSREKLITNKPYLTPILNEAISKMAGRLL